MSLFLSRVSHQIAVCCHGSRALPWWCTTTVVHCHQGGQLWRSCRSLLLIVVLTSVRTPPWTCPVSLHAVPTAGGVIAVVAIIVAYRNDQESPTDRRTRIFIKVQGSGEGGRGGGGAGDVFSRGLLAHTARFRRRLLAVCFVALGSASGAVVFG